jgi:RNA polymerase sigma factor (TIGR02999 family)
MDSRQGDVTRLLLAWSGGEASAMDELISVVYDQLRHVAERSLRSERTGHTLQATALVNEVYLRLVDQRHVRWQHRAHFFAVAATLMRRILVDHARRHRAAKRGGGAPTVTLDEAVIVAVEPTADFVSLDEALERLAAIDPRQARVVDLKFFGGLTIEETAEVLTVSPATVKNEWSLARAWLYRELYGGARPAGSPGD